MNRNASIAIASLNVLISVAFLVAYLVETFWYEGTISALWVWVGYLYIYSLVFFVAPSLLVWAIILLARVKRIKKNSVWAFSAKLFGFTIIFHLIIFYSFRVHSNKVELAFSNYSELPVTELEVEARNNESFRLSKLEPGDKETFHCYCARIEYPYDTGIKLKFKVNGKNIEGFISGRYSPIHNKEIEIRILNDSAFYQSYDYSSGNEWTDFNKYTSTVKKWQEIIKKKSD
ncbi:hypothetical protein [Pontibacter mangrovi]|uniref:Uncharacterized protein n=1 Tax=Pontibacter mangrovi TaxID=2589816 RepID=A0A501W054_9BACT|nr:hypothetical protein [Pontibacter mangrovi]TPE42102.1 hypothetical protein FJM65_18620 [Pontibacter mangrovi]